ncbi:HCP-like protein [Powellomyces hirtus]|nr:HCP-like protein [Powellomyces hirtus]
MGTPPVAPSDAPRPTFRKLTVRKPARNPAVGPTPTAPTAEESKANVTKVSLLKTIEMYRLNALKSGDSGLKFEFAKYCIEESVKAPDQKTRDLMIEEGFSLLKELGRAGSSEAMYTLGQAYLDDQQFSLAHSQLLAAAKRSHPGAMYLLGIMSEKGAGTKKSTRVAMDFYTKSAQAGYKPALYRLGMIELFGQLSGGKKDVKKGIMWLKRGAAVADRDHPECLHQLALVYEDGLPPHAQQDESYAKGLLIEAAELDYAPSQYKLACCYEFERLGCERDLSEAMHWYTLAAENDNADAQFALAGWYLQGLEGMLPADPYKAYAWTYRAAMKDHAKAQYAIGYFCDLGIGCEQNQEKADRWYRLAAALGEERAIAKVGLPPPPHDGKKSTRSLSPSELNQHMQPNAAPPGKEAKGLFSFLKK